MLAMTSSSHKLPTDRARELFKTPEEAESLRESICFKFGAFGFEHFSVTLRLGEVVKIFFIT